MKARNHGPNLRYNYTICLEGLRKVTKTSGQSPEQDFNSKSPDCKALLSTQLQHSVTLNLTELF